MAWPQSRQLCGGGQRLLDGLVRMGCGEDSRGCRRKRHRAARAVEMGPTRRRRPRAPAAVVDGRRLRHATFAGGGEPRPLDGRPCGRHVAERARAALSARADSSTADLAAPQRRFVHGGAGRRRWGSTGPVGCATRSARARGPPRVWRATSASGWFDARSRRRTLDARRHGRRAVRWGAIGRMCVAFAVSFTNRRDVAQRASSRALPSSAARRSRRLGLERGSRARATSPRVLDDGGRRGRPPTLPPSDVGIESPPRRPIVPRPRRGASRRRRRRARARCALLPGARRSRRRVRFRPSPSSLGPICRPASPRRHTGTRLLRAAGASMRAALARRARRAHPRRRWTPGGLRGYRRAPRPQAGGTGRRCAPYAAPGGARARGAFASIGRQAWRRGVSRPHASSERRAAAATASPINGRDRRRAATAHRRFPARPSRRARTRPVRARRRAFARRRRRELESPTAAFRRALDAERSRRPRRPRGLLGVAGRRRRRLFARPGARLRARARARDRRRARARGAPTPRARRRPRCGRRARGAFAARRRLARDASASREPTGRGRSRLRDGSSRVVRTGRAARARRRGARPGERLGATPRARRACRHRTTRCSARRASGATSVGACAPRTPTSLMRWRDADGATRRDEARSAARRRRVRAQRDVGR